MGLYTFTENSNAPVVVPATKGNMNLVYPLNLFSRTQSVSPSFIKFSQLEVVKQAIVEESVSDLAEGTAAIAKGVLNLDLADMKDGVTGLGEALKTTASRFANAEMRVKPTGNDVALYMPGSIQINDSLVYETIDTKGVTDFLAHVFNETGGASNIESFINALKNNQSAAGHILANHVLSKHARSGSAFSGLAGNALLASGRVANPATKLLFRSPNLRQFQVDFRFTPQSQDEAIAVTKIISLFRQGAYPLVTSGGALFNVPSMWRIKFGFKKQELNPFLIHFKECFLTNITTTYNGSGIAAFFPDGSPVETNLSMTFQEAELNSASDIHGTRSASDVASSDNSAMPGRMPGIY